MYTIRSLNLRFNTLRKTSGKLNLILQQGMQFCNWISDANEGLGGRNDGGTAELIIVEEYYA